MNVYEDRIFKDLNGRLYTKEYLEHNGKLTEAKLGSGSVYFWEFGGETMQLTPDDEIRYSFENKHYVNCNYSQLFKDFDNMILCCNLADYEDEFDLCNGVTYNEEDDCFVDIYQWFIIDENLASVLRRHTNEIIYYWGKMDLYILGVTHWGTSWDYVGTEYYI